MTETRLEQQFCDYAVVCGCRPVKLIKASGRGWPDRTVLCPGGRVVLFEFKKPGGRLSAIQKKVNGFLTGIGFTVHVCHDLEDAKAKLRQFLELYHA